MPFSADLAQRIRFVKQTWSARRNKPTKGITQRNKPIQHLLGLQLLFKLFYGEFQLQKLHFGSQKNKKKTQTRTKATVHKSKNKDLPDNVMDGFHLKSSIFLFSSIGHNQKQS